MSVFSISPSNNEILFLPAWEPMLKSMGGMGRRVSPCAQNRGVKGVAIRSQKIEPCIPLFVRKELLYWIKSYEICPLFLLLGPHPTSLGSVDSIGLEEIFRSQGVQDARKGSIHPIQSR